MTLDQLETQLASLTLAEKAQVLRWLEHDVFGAIPGIEATPDVCGGEPCIAGSRIPIWVLERARQLGSSEAELLRAYPTLKAQDLVNAWAYIESHRDEIARQIRENEAA